MRDQVFKLVGILCLMLSVFLVLFGLYLTDDFAGSGVRTLTTAGGVALLCVGSFFYKLMIKES